MVAVIALNRSRVMDYIYHHFHNYQVYKAMNGLYLRVGSSIYNGNGFPLGLHSPFKDIPILKLIL